MRLEILKYTAENNSLSINLIQKHDTVLFDWTGIMAKSLRNADRRKDRKKDFTTNKSFQFKSDANLV